MIRNLFVIVVFILFCGCASAPMEKQHVTLAKDYDDYIVLKEVEESKTIPQKIASVFKKKEPEVVDTPPQQAKKYPRRENSKKLKMPSRRIRQTNTNEVSSSNQLMSMAPRSEEQITKPSSNYFLFFIYAQAFIIAFLSVYTFFKIRSFKKNKDKSTRELNL